jgi:hypothetical protein
VLTGTSFAAQAQSVDNKTKSEQYGKEIKIVESEIKTLKLKLKADSGNAELKDELKSKTSELKELKSNKKVIDTAIKATKKAEKATKEAQKANKAAEKVKEDDSCH